MTVSLGYPVRCRPAAPAGARPFFNPGHSPSSTRIARASSPGRRRGGQAEACFPWVSIVTLRAIEATCSHEYLCLNLRAIDDEKFEIVGFPGPTAGAGGGDVTSPCSTDRRRVSVSFSLCCRRYLLRVVLRGPAAALPPVCLLQYFECSFGRLRRVLQW